MKVFMSTPFKGKTEDDIDDECRRVFDLIRKLKICAKEEHITVVHNFNVVQRDHKNCPYRIREAIKIMGDCDLVIFMPGWRFSKNCIVERYVGEHSFVPEQIIEIESIEEVD